MNRSLNEIQRICQKAAEGCGAPAGLDTEAATGAAWLLSHGFDVLDDLAVALSGFPDLARSCCFDGLRWEEPDQVIDASGKAGALIGPMLVDLLVGRASAAAQNDQQKGGRGELRVERLTSPLFLLPPAAAYARDGWAFRFALDGPGGRFALVMTPQDGACVLGPEAGASANDALRGDAVWTLQGLCARRGEDVADPVETGLSVLASPEALAAARTRSLAEGVPVRPEPWARLQTLALKVLVPASDESRLKGAGARASDNE